MVKSFSQLYLFMLFFVLGPCIFSPAALAGTEEEMLVLGMFYSKTDLVITPTRTPKPVSQVAENITVITAKDIGHMNAHTLSDVVNTIPGVQLALKGGMGTAANVLIQGSENRHVLVIIDGVTLNNLSDNYADVGAMPVQHIERIEIIKGPASSSWGSSLGGVINIITKSSDRARSIGGTASASYGERNTGDYRAEISGGSGSAGYYVYAGNLASRGMRPNTSFEENNLYSKIDMDVTDELGLMLTFGYSRGDRGIMEYPMFDQSMDNDFEYLFSTLRLNYSFNDEAGVELSLRTSRQNMEFLMNQLSTGESMMMSADDSTDGASLKFRWNRGAHNIVIGADYDDSLLESEAMIKGGEQGLEKKAVYVNDTITLGRFTFIPGLRYDDTDTNDDFLSPSFGITYQFGEDTVLRGFAARGFNIPLLIDTYGKPELFYYLPNPELEVEKVWSIQAGVETKALKYVWLRLNLFKHNISDPVVTILTPEFMFQSVNGSRQKRQGFEVEMQTVPFYNTSVFAGFAFIEAKDRDTREMLIETPRYTYDIGVNYSNRSCRASLKGHYIWWVPDPIFPAEYNSFVWDMNIAKDIKISDRTKAELFLTGHNIFNASQYLLDVYKNAPRWIEAGARFRF